MKTGKINFKLLKKLYIVDQKSSKEISGQIGCSPSRVNYWLKKYNIPKRSISESVYLKYNPAGDPFKFTPPRSFTEAKLYGLGLGLYWGEGNKANRNTVRLGNSDPALLNKFIEFLIVFFKIKKKDLKVHLQIFSDIDINEARTYWKNKLKIKKEQFYKPLITKSGKLGTYKNKSRYGVLTLYYGNVKLKNKLMDLLPL